PHFRLQQEALMSRAPFFLSALVFITLAGCGQQAAREAGHRAEGPVVEVPAVDFSERTQKESQPLSLHGIHDSFSMSPASGEARAEFGGSQLGGSLSAPGIFSSTLDIPQTGEGSGGSPAKVVPWKRSQVVPNTSRLSIGEKEELPLKGLQADVRIDGF